MNEDKEPFCIGSVSLIIIFGALIISMITIFSLIQVYESYKLNEKYIIDTQAYYTADGEATLKRALIEEELYKVYYSNRDIKYDLKHIKRAIQDIKDIEIVESEKKKILIYYEEPINEKETLKIELEAAPQQRDANITHFTQVNKWQVIEQNKL